MAQLIRSIDDIRKYKATLEKKLANGCSDMEENDDCAHNAVVNTVMLEKCDNIRMYCGQMALFHKKFYDRIKNETENPKCADEARLSFKDALKNFVNRPKAHLTIFVENYEKIDPAEMLDADLINDALRRNVIEIFEVNGNLVFKSPMQHMTVGDRNRIVRWETDKKLHTAQCFFYVDRSFENNTTTLFSYLKDASTRITHVGK